MKKTKNRPSHFGVQVGKEYIENHRPKWDKLPGPIILIYVDFHSRKAWWTDLRDDQTYTEANKNIILVPKNQRFGKHSFGEFKNLKGRLFISKDIPEIEMNNSHFASQNLNQGIKQSAKQFYNDWNKSPVIERTHPELGEIIVSRTGWRHITRTDRKQNRMINSLSLLPVAKQIILSTNKCYQVRNLETRTTNNLLIVTDYLAIKCNVKFPFRQSGLIQVILKRKRKLDSNNNTIGSRIWFYSIYEPLSNK